jgi:hypothetical protein
MRYPKLSALPLLIPGALYIAVALFWQSHDLYQIIGDEPHYLLISESIISDGDLRVYDDSVTTTPVHLDNPSVAEPIRDVPHVARESKGYSIHGIGLPVVLSLPYLLGGVTGAKFAMAALAALWPFLFYRVVYRITGSKLLAVLVALTLACGLPYLAASNQIFPDLLGGLIILYVVERTATLLSSKESGPSSYTALFATTLIAFLPWLHLRLTAPALVLLGGYAYARVATDKRYPFLPIVPVGLSLALFGFYNQVAFGNPVGPYTSGAISLDVKKVGMIFLGLHLDRMQGMFTQQPLLLLGLVGIVPLVRAAPRFAILLGTLYLSIIVANAAHTNWYGGFSFAGRFGWAAISLWVFPLSYALKHLWGRTKVLVFALSACALALQVWFATKWLLHDWFLYNRFRTNISPEWPVGGLYAGLPGGEPVATWVPFFGAFDLYLHHPSNYVFVLLCIILVLSGLFLRDTRTQAPT